MAFWNNDELEALKGKLIILQEKFDKLEENSESSDAYLELKKRFDLKCKFLKEQAESLGRFDRKIESLEKELGSSVSKIFHEDEMMRLQAEVVALRGQIDTLKHGKAVHNERSAGRKSRITETDITMASRWHEQGKSLSEIAKLLTEKDGIPWSRSTVKYLLAQHGSGKNGK